eukprot:TRINITY_DN2501_c0_g1_i1.p1 TRINITY_DN2501_c0_g1~~TRINITY_DN2501_c0_g1_i1.p1  ORF type:complete len:295 (-),score=108.42 TRINITY_DN2501_c0_g1_i1:68-952(-)
MSAHNQDNIFDDEDLESVLSSALEDFEKDEEAVSKPAPAPAPAPTPTLFAAPSNATSADDGAFDLSDLDVNVKKLLEEFAGDESFAKTMEELSKAFEDPTNAKAAAPSGSTSSASSAASGDGGFKDTMSKAFDSLKKSSESNKDTVSSDDPFADILNMLAQGGTSVEGLEKMFSQEGDSADAGKGLDGSIDGAMEGLLKHFVSKDLLYEPLLNMKTKYPDYLRDNRSKLDRSQFEKCEKQYDCIAKLCDLYEDPNHKVETIIEVLQQMQEQGEIPQEIINELAPGMDISQIFSA